MKKYKKDIAISHPLGWLLSKKQKITSVGKDVEKRDPLVNVGGNVDWCSHYVEQYGGSSKNYNNYHMIQQFNFWVFFQRQQKH